MTAEPHPLRCETCKVEHSENPYIRYAHGSGFFKCMGELMPIETPSITSMKGCASHSASNDVLEELRKNVVKLYDDGFKDPLVTFDAAVSLMKHGDLKIRQQTKEREHDGIT